MQYFYRATGHDSNKHCLLSVRYDIGNAKRRAKVSIAMFTILKSCLSSVIFVNFTDRPLPSPISLSRSRKERAHK